MKYQYICNTDLFMEGGAKERRFTKGKIYETDYLITEKAWLIDDIGSEHGVGGGWEKYFDLVEKESVYPIFN